MSDELVEVVPMSPAERGRYTTLNNQIAEHRDAFELVGNSLAEVKQRELWREEFDSFAAYLRGKWSWSPSFAYALTYRSEMTTQLRDENVIGERDVLTHGQASSLRTLPEERRGEAFQSAQSREETESRPSEQSVRDVVREIRSETTDPITGPNTRAHNVLKTEAMRAYRIVVAKSTALGVVDSISEPLNAIRRVLSNA